MNFAPTSPRSLASVLTVFGMILAAGVISPLPAQEVSGVGALIQQIGQIQLLHEAAISPDGKTVAWSVETPDGMQIHLTDLADSENDTTLRTEAEASDCSSEKPVWSPNGKWLAFESTCAAKADKPDQEQIFVWS